MKTVKSILVALAETYGAQMTEIRMNAYLGALKDLTEHEWKKAYGSLLNDPSITRMPLPAQIRQAARPKADPRTSAIASLDRLREAVRRFGWPQPDKAEEFLTTQEWAFVGRRGGWQNFCGTPENNLNDTTVYAQMRDALQSENVANEKGLEYMALGTGPKTAEIEAGGKRQISSAKEIVGSVLGGFTEQRT